MMYNVVTISITTKKIRIGLQTDPIYHCLVQFYGHNANLSLYAHNEGTSFANCMTLGRKKKRNWQQVQPRQNGVVYIISCSSIRRTAAKIRRTNSII
jgi:hypothetical protein